MEKEEEENYLEVINRLADKVIASSFALWERRKALKNIVKDIEGINWSVVAYESMLLFQHLIDRYAFGLYGAETRATIMDSLYEPLVRKYAETGAIRAERINDLYRIFVDNLNERNEEYGGYQLEKAIVDEFTMGRDEPVRGDSEREKIFSTILLTDAAIRDAKSSDFKYLETSLLWQFAKRIAELLGEPNSIKVIVYVRNYAIAGLTMIHPLKELQIIVNI
jgi:hypothetical protein